MRLCRIRTADGIKPAVCDDEGQLRDMSGVVADITPAQITPAGLATLSAVDPTGLPVITGGYAPFLANPGRVLCIGLNFYDHAEEMGMAIPEHPIMFMKACEITGANDPIVLPVGSEKTDWEVELGVVIGTAAKNVTEADAIDHVAGYFVGNDVSERYFQLELGGQWMKGKSSDTFAPVGPYLVTKDSVADVGNLAMSLEVNGEVQQSGSTATMIFNVAQIVSQMSRFISLRPGDMILTGTPPGVGVGQKPQKFLKAGDVVTAEITGLGRMRHEVVAS
jgi:2-keto-4-pentenoate hydratase/2-oxohepta-3-ene-1,7-dioic acid hydratase in catechol pathway